MSRERRIISYAEHRKLRYQLTRDGDAWSAELRDLHNGAPVYVGTGTSKRAALKRLLGLLADDWRERGDPYG